jgi:hypothetical protein
MTELDVDGGDRDVLAVEEPAVVIVHRYEHSVPRPERERFFAAAARELGAVQVAAFDEQFADLVVDAGGVVAGRADDEDCIGGGWSGGVVPE